MSNVVTLNRPALWRPIRSDDTIVRKYAGAYPYQTKSGLVARSTIESPVIRYARNFGEGDLTYSIFIFSDETDLAKVEAFMETLAKKVTKKSIKEMLMTASMSSFVYLDTYYERKKS